MKTTNPTPPDGRPLPLLRRSLALILLLAGSIGTTRAENVDSELLLLVDITRSGLSNTEFSSLMDGYANAFTSTEVLDSIQSGAHGRIAVSMMFYGNSSTQTTGIPWMMIGSLAEAQAFANLARGIQQPTSNSNSDLAAALGVATLSFGTETGGTANGFESTTQVIEIASAKRQSPPTAAGVAARSATALASGVDLINAIAIGNQASAIESFYMANVVGSTIEGVAPTTSIAGNSGSVAPAVAAMVTGTVTTGATQSINAVPEPSTIFGLLPATLLLLKRRR